MSNLCKTVEEMKMSREKQYEKDAAQDAVMAEMQRKQAFQEGLFTAKLDSVEKALIRIETYLSQWEAADAESK
jgi:septation ring formation regulator EzrA